MTVKELILLLEKEEPEAEVAILCYEHKEIHTILEIGYKRHIVLLVEE